MSEKRSAAEGLAREVAAAAIALLGAMAVGSVLVLAYGESPLAVYRMLLAGTWGNAYGIGQVLFKATPLIFTGLAVAVAYRAGLFNIGAEGQLTLGALVMAMVALRAGSVMPGVLAILLATLAGMAAGGAAAALPGWLKARFGAHEVINTIMLNFVLLAFVNYAVAQWWHEPESLHTAAIPEGTRLPRLAAFAGAFHGSAANISFFVALALALAAHWLFFRSRYGFELGVMGQNIEAAHATGIPVRRRMVSAMAISGAFAGLVGLNFVLGYKYYFEEGFSAGVGFMGIAVALLGGVRPLGIVLAALFFGTLSQGGLVINAVVPKEIVDVLQAVVILGVAAANGEVRRLLGARS